MGNEEKVKYKANKAGRICSAAGTVMILLVIALCSLLVLPGILGYHMYHVLSGSMEPNVPVGSLIYVGAQQPEDIVQGDIIAFYGSMEDAGIITHRVVENHIVSGTFTTKGDANEGEDPLPVSYDNFIGKVIYTVPYMGKVMTVMTSLYGKIAAGSIVVLGVILNIAGSRQKKG